MSCEGRARERIALVAIALLGVGGLGGISGVRAQTPQDPPRPSPVAEVPDSTVVDPAQRLRLEIDRLLRAGRNADAIAQLEQARAEGALDTGLARRLARLYRDAGRLEDLEALLVERGGAELRQLDLVELKMLAETRFELEKTDEGRATIAALVQRDPMDPSLVQLGATVLSQQGETIEAVELLLQGREQLQRPREFAQLLGRYYAQLGRPVESAREYANVIVESPLNVSLMRAQIVELAARFPDALVAMLFEVEQIAQRQDRIPQLGVVVAELRLRNDDPEGAWDALQPALAEGSLVQDLLRLSMAQLADSRLPDADPARSLRSLRLGARIARALMESTQLPQSLRPRVYDTLVRTLLTMLENPAFAQLTETEQLTLLDETREAVVAMNRQFPNNRLTAAAMLRLANAYIDALGRPEQAIELYQILSMDPGASREQIGLAQLGLAKGYVASGDTALGREVLLRIANDVDFVEGQGRAQYELGLLDFMGGHFETAVERFKAVAFASPKAAYSNDALDLALVLTEEQMAAAPDEQGLNLYGRALYYRAIGRRDSLRSELEGLDRRAPSVIRERARVDLARLYYEDGESDRALQFLERSVQEAPKSRYATSALVLKGDVLSEVGREAEALAVYESVLVDHEGYVFVDRLRDKIRTLRGEAPEAEEELP